jgi:hypothetical protein
MQKWAGISRLTRALGPGAAIIEIVSEALLPRVEIDCRDTLSSFEQGNGDMQRGRGFSRAAFFVAEHDNVSGLFVFLDRLDQHRRVL